MSEIINYTRLTTSDKLSDKFVTGQVYLPQDKDQASLGQIFSHIEILSPWFTASQIGQTVINTVIKEYYRGRDSSDLVNFEEAIKKVNESLAQTAQSGETEWIGKFSGVIILVNKEEIHFAQTGKSHAYLYRAGKVNHITEGLENEDAPHPLKTFSNLTSGTLQDSDKIVIANNSFFEVISPSELKLIVSSLPPALSAIECAKILQNHGSQDASAIFFELTTREKLADLPPEQKIEAVYLDQQILTLSAMSKNALANFSSSLGGMLKKSSGKIADFSKDKVIPLTKRAIEKRRSANKDQSEYFEKENNSFADDDQTVNVHAKNKASDIIDNLKTSLLKLKNKLRRSLIHIGLYTRKKSKMYLALLVVVLVALILVVGFSLQSRKKSANEAQAKQNFNEIITLAGQADVLFNTNQSQSLDKYNSVIALADKLKGTKYSDQAKPIIDKATRQVQAVSKLTRLEAKNQVELKSATSIAVNEKFIFAISGSDLYSRSLNTNSFTKLAALGLEITNLNYISELDLLTGVNNNKIVFFDTTGSSLKTAETSLKKPTQLRSYGSNLYAFDLSQNQIMKIPFQDKTFSNSSDYLKDKSDLSKISDFTLDGSLYTLDKAGLVTRYSRGNKLGDFSIILPGQEKLDEFISILATESSTDFTILARKAKEYRIIIVNKNGEFQKQYSLAGISDTKSVSIDSTNKKLYILSDQKIFDFELN